MVTVIAAVLTLVMATPERAGAVWSTHGPDGGDVTALAVEPGAPTRLYAGTSLDGVFRSRDGGTTWHPARTGLGNGVIYALVTDPVTPGLVYAATNDTVFKSSDGGTSWLAL
ncbi:MAG: hypothetical protein H6Q34_938, partial [Deltaproteobacteria bacterium]|nr:hypothetical protein [Deltaproteobacteria bacterium]